MGMTTNGLIIRKQNSANEELKLSKTGTKMSSLDTNGSRGATDFNCGGVWIVGRQPADVLVRLILTDSIITLQQ